ncbi:hypothetical protein RR48_12859 [Papilio machaon]|uniref:Uncharacterized protein n=1 Tax=Papilio machaon TaxID=76193 RepID=A0A194QSZ3_PAPMA|nr:hypothetical protein RR48_12859 [Papilio machaon]
MIIWLIKSVRRNRKISMKEGNFILSILLDITMGYFILELLLKDKKDLGILLMGILEFRVLSMLVQYILAKCIYLLQTFPLYVFILWITKSTKVAGNVFLEVVKNDETSVLMLQIKLFTVPLQYLVNNFKPPVEVSKHVEWSNIVSNIVTGKQII